MVIEEIEYALMDCKTEADFLVINNLKLATHVANTLRWTGAEYEDLLQWARLALVRAAKGYRPEVGVKFSSYAYPAMQREVLRALFKNPDAPKNQIHPLLVSLEQPISDHGYVFGDTIPEERDCIEDCVNHMFVEALTENLTEFERDVLYERFALELPRREIGRIHGKSHEWIRMVENRTLENMRRAAG